MKLLLETQKLGLTELSLLNNKDEVKVMISVPIEKTKEDLLSFVKKLLIKSKINQSNIDFIEVQASGEGFTTTRLRVAIANALAYALNIPVKPISGKALKKKGIMIVPPLYSQPPNITTKKQS